MGKFYIRIEFFSSERKCVKAGTRTKILASISNALPTELSGRHTNQNNTRSDNHLLMI